MHTYETFIRHISSRVNHDVKSGANALGVLIGNTRELWQVFVDECRCNPGLLDNPDPLDQYIMQRIASATAQGDPPPSRIFWSHVPMGEGDDFLAMQHLAAAIGLAYLDDASHLCLHPKHGPWFSMRAILVWDDIAYTGECGCLSTSCVCDVFPHANPVLAYHHSLLPSQQSHSTPATLAAQPTRPQDRAIRALCGTVCTQQLFWPE